MRVAKVAGIQLKFNIFFLALMALFSCFGLGGKALMVFGSVFWHELMHTLAAVSFGLRVREIEMLPFGGVARIECLGEAEGYKEGIIAAAGPVASLVLAAAAYFSSRCIPMWEDYLTFLLQVNVMLAVFNMLPAIPLDGGRMLRALLTRYYDHHKATLVAVKISRAIAFVLVVIVINQYFISKTVNLTFMVAIAFLLVSGKTEIKLAGFRSIRILAQKRAVLRERGILPVVHFSVMDYTPVREVIKIFDPSKYHIVLVLDGNYQVQGSLTETEIWNNIVYNGLYGKIGHFLRDA